MFIFNLASQHGQWLAARQAAAASNIANINTPGYKAMDVAPFDQVLERTGLTMTATHGAHMQAVDARFQPLEMEREHGWDITHSGNTVTLEAELMKIGENGRMLALDSGLTRMFHRMLLASLKVS
jgi:flagellar basal-body rod protein FlgB